MAGRAESWWPHSLHHMRGQTTARDVCDIQADQIIIVRLMGC